jgi:hypothetical protein
MKKYSKTRFAISCAVNFYNTGTNAGASSTASEFTITTQAL